MDHFFIVVHADWQTGCLFGLANPETILPRYDEYGDIKDLRPIRLTATEEQLWKWFMEDAAVARELIGEVDWYHFFLGDITHGTYFGNTLHSDRYSDQILLAKDCFRGWWDQMTCPPRAVRFAKGTGAHSMKEGSSELLLADWMSDSGVDAEAWHQAVVTLAGLDIDIAHKGPMTGSRPWVEGDDMRRYAKAEMMRHIMAGKKPPDLFLRGHYHDRIIEDIHLHTWSGTYRAWGAVCPAYSIMKDDWTRSATKSKSVMCSGTLIVEVVDGEILKVHDLTHYLDLRRKEILR